MNRGKTTYEIWKDELAGKPDPWTDWLIVLGLPAVVVGACTALACLAFICFAR